MQYHDQVARRAISKHNLISLSHIQFIHSLAKALQWFEKELFWGAEVARGIEVDILDPISNSKKARTFGTDIINSLA